MNRQARTLVVATIALFVLAPVGAACDTDMNESGATDFADLLYVIGQWGPCTGCPADLDGSGDVSFADVLMVVADWGPCLFEYGPPRDNLEAEQIGLELLGPNGPLVLGDELYDRIDGDLELIRADQATLVNIIHSPRWSPRHIIAYLAPGVPTDDFDDLNEFYQVESVVPLIGNAVVVTLPGSLNIPALLPQYQVLASVQNASRDDVIGRANTWQPVPMLDETWQWHVDHGFGDCPSGCICHTLYELEVTGEGVVTLLSVETQGGGNCPFEF